MDEILIRSYMTSSHAGELINQPSEIINTWLENNMYEVLPHPTEEISYVTPTLVRTSQFYNIFYDITSYFWGVFGYLIFNRLPLDTGTGLEALIS